MNKIGTYGLIGMAFCIPAALLLGCLDKAHAGPLENAAVYAIDRHTCNLYIPQEWVNESLVGAMQRYGLTLKEALGAAADIGVSLERQIRETGQLQVYCRARTASEWR